MIKDIYGKPTANIILSSETLSTFLLDQEPRKDSRALLFHLMLEMQDIVARTKIRKKQNHLHLQTAH